jgi:hypothetical protein
MTSGPNHGIGMMEWVQMMMLMIGFSMARRIRRENRMYHPYRGEEQIETMNSGAENHASPFSGRRWFSRDVDHWPIRIKTAKQIHFDPSDEEGNSHELRTRTLDLWRVIRDRQLPEMDPLDPQEITQLHHAQTYNES